MLLMKKLLVLLPFLLWSAGVQAQNIEGQIIASQYGRWKVPGYAPNTYSSFAPDFVPGAGGRQLLLRVYRGHADCDRRRNPSLTETVTPTSTVDSNVTCAITHRAGQQSPGSVLSDLGHRWAAGSSQPEPDDTADQYRSSWTTRSISWWAAPATRPP